MANLWELPKSVKTANGHEYAIRTDFRAVLDLLTALSDREICGVNEIETSVLHTSLMLQIMVPNYEKVEPDDLSEVLKGIGEFIDMSNKPKDGKKAPSLMDWEQDAGLIIPEINKLAGKEVRAVEYMHWWTFLSYYMAIGEGTFANVVNVRSKRAKGKKLEKWEQEFFNHNKDVIILKEKLTDEEAEELEREKKFLEEIFG